MHKAKGKILASALIERPDNDRVRLLSPQLGELSKRTVKFLNEALEAFESLSQKPKSWEFRSHDSISGSRMNFAQQQATAIGQSGSARFNYSSPMHAGSIAARAVPAASSRVVETIYRSSVNDQDDDSDAESAGEPRQPFAPTSLRHTPSTYATSASSSTSAARTRQPFVPTSPRHTPSTYATSASSSTSAARTPSQHMRSVTSSSSSSDANEDDDDTGQVKAGPSSASRSSVGPSSASRSSVPRDLSEAVRSDSEDDANDTKPGEADAGFEDIRPRKKRARTAKFSDEAKELIREVINDNWRDIDFPGLQRRIKALTGDQYSVASLREKVKNMRKGR